VIRFPTQTGHRSLVRRAVGATLLATALAGILVACGGGVSFDPSGPCAVDGRAAGAYPDLEALAPTSFDGQPPTTLDSGRNCSDEALGALTSHGVHELRFGGATWDFGNGRGMTIATLGLPDAPLPIAWAEEFYELGARNAKRTEHVDVTRPDMTPLGAVFRLDTLNDLSFQTIVLWADGDRVRVVIVASPVSLSASRDDHDALVASAVATATAGAPAEIGGGG
jgi:hypothetical protein